MDKKAIYDKYFTRVYYFALHYLNENERAADAVVEAFVALFNGKLGEEDAIKEFLYGHVAGACKFYYSFSLRIPAPEVEDFFNTRLDAEFLYLKYQERESIS